MPRSVPLRSTATLPGRAAWRPSAIPSTGLPLPPHSAPRCRARAELAVAEGRAADLLRAELRDPRAARAYEQVHGLCLHHGLTWHGPLPAPARVVLGARLALLGRDVEEALRRRSWRTRHEIRTGRTDAGRRAPTLLDGRVYSGQPHGERVEFTRDSATAAELTRTRRTSWNSM